MQLKCSILNKFCFSFKICEVFIIDNTNLFSSRALHISTWYPKVFVPFWTNWELKNPQPSELCLQPWAVACDPKILFWWRHDFTHPNKLDHNKKPKPSVVVCRPQQPSWSRASWRRGSALSWWSSMKHPRTGWGSRSKVWVLLQQTGRLCTAQSTRWRSVSSQIKFVYFIHCLS